MRINRLFLSILALSLALLACNFPFQSSEPEPEIPSPPPTLAPPPDGADPACLIGSWQVIDLSSYVLAAIPQETIDEYNLQYEGASGSVTIGMDPNGFFGLNANDFKMEFNSKVAVFTVPLTVNLNGTATGTYLVNGSTITTQNVDTSSLTASAEAAGQQIMEPAQIIQSIPMLQPPYNQASFICNGDSLQLTIANYPESIPPLVFQRVQ